MAYVSHRDRQASPSATMRVFGRNRTCASPSSPPRPHAISTTICRRCSMRCAAAATTSTIVDWDDAAVRWSDFDIALLRSTWDYSQRLPEFLEWASHVSTQTQLRNPLPVIRWNTDKHYLHDLEKSGVAIVPSTFIEPATMHRRASMRSSPEHACDEFVVKPSVGAGSRDAQRYSRKQRDEAVAHARRLLDAQSQRAVAAVSGSRRRTRRNRADLLRRPFQPRHPQGSAAAKE